MYNLPQFCVPAVQPGLDSQIQQKIDQKTKPTGSLGQLESLAFQLARIQQTLCPKIVQPHLLVFVADHGIATEKTSAYPQQVTAQMLLNFLQGGAAIHVFCKLNNLELSIIDAGVKQAIQHPKLHSARVGAGTKNFLHEPAMTEEKLNQALGLGAGFAQQVCQQGTNLLGFGEMGIGNTAAASLLMHWWTGIVLKDCVGIGSGLNLQQWRHKYQVLCKVKNQHNLAQASPRQVMACLGGFEMVQMAGAMLAAASQGAMLLIDGFVASTAFLFAKLLAPNVQDYAVFCHQSAEKGHALLLQFLDAKPLLNLNLRLGEGTGCALAYPLIQAAEQFINHMASFEQAGVALRLD